MDRDELIKLKADGWLINVTRLNSKDSRELELFIDDNDFTVERGQEVTKTLIEKIYEN